MVYILAQARCTITPLSPTTLTTTGGAIVSGTMNVRIRCNCTESGGRAVSIVRWYDPAGAMLHSVQHLANFDRNVPHFTIVNGEIGDIVDNTDIMLHSMTLMMVHTLVEGKRVSMIVCIFFSCTSVRQRFCTIASISLEKHSISAFV